MMLSKKMLLVLIFCVFIVGTFSFVGSAEAAKWKKIDSGKFTNEYPPEGYQKFVKYKSFVKDKNKIFYYLYYYPKNGSAKKLAFRVTLTKKDNVITEKSKDYFSKEIEINSYKTKLDVTKFYKNKMKNIIKVSTTSPDKLAFDTQNFIVNNPYFKFYFKLYGIKMHKNYIIAYFYEDNEEYSTFKIYKKDKKIIYKEYNQKRKLTIKETYKTTKTITSIYKTKKNKLIKKIKTEVPNEINGKVLVSKNKAIAIVKKLDPEIKKIESVELGKDPFNGKYVWEIYAETKNYDLYVSIDAKSGKIERHIVYGGGNPGEDG